jgi:hypothetical protein
MPLWQMNEVMTKDFGTNWRDQFQEFQDRPFAAARLNLFFSSQIIIPIYFLLASVKFIMVF